jgi:hypothetical protein
LAWRWQQCTPAHAPKKSGAGDARVTFDERRIKQIERSLGRKLTEEERRLFLSGVTHEVCSSAGVTTETVS